MSKRAVLSAAVIIAAMTSACGTQQAASGSGGTASGTGGTATGTGGTAGGTGGTATGTGGTKVPVTFTPVPAGPVRHGCAGTRPTPAGHTLTINAGGNTQTFCVRRGAQVFVVLQGLPARKWSPIRLTGSALAPRPDGRLALMVGATGAAYAAVHPGRAVITSARRVCAGSVPIGAGTSYPPGPATAVKSPNPIVGCDSLLTFHATVIVHP